MNRKRIAQVLIVGLMLPLLLIACGKQKKQTVKEEPAANVKTGQPAAAEKADKTAKTEPAEGKKASGLKKDDAAAVMSEIPEEIGKRIDLTKLTPETGKKTSWQYFYFPAEQKVRIAFSFSCEGDLQKHADFYAGLLTDSKINAPNPEQMMSVMGGLNDSEHTVQLRKLTSKEGKEYIDVMIIADNAASEGLLPANGIPFQKQLVPDEKAETIITSASSFESKEVTGTYYYVMYAAKSTQEEAIAVYEKAMKGLEGFSRFEDKGTWYLKGKIGDFEIQTSISALSENKLSVPGWEANFVNISVGIR